MAYLDGTTRLGLGGGPRGQWPGFSAQASAVVTGTVVTDGVLESEIVAGGETIIITLTGDTWVSGASFNDTVKQAIIDGLDAAASPTNGWNNEVRDKEVVGAVVRTSDTVVTITLTAAAGYSISSDETITVTVPASALSGSTEVAATPTFTVTAEAEVTGGAGAGASYGYPRVPHRWPREQKRRKRLYEDFEEALEELEDASPQAKREAVEALEPIIGPARFDVDSLERKVEAAIVAARGRQELTAIRRKLKELEDIIDDDEVEMLLLQ